METGIAGNGEILNKRPVRALAVRVGTLIWASWHIDADRDEALHQALTVADSTHPLLDVLTLLGELEEALRVRAELEVDGDAWTSHFDLHDAQPGDRVELARELAHQRIDHVLGCLLRNPARHPAADGRPERIAPPMDATITCGNLCGATWAAGSSATFATARTQAVTAGWKPGRDGVILCADCPDVYDFELPTQDQLNAATLDDMRRAHEFVHGLTVGVAA